MEPYQQIIFNPAREALSKYYDDREVLIRLCRDINSISKKVIFSGHRIKHGCTESSINDLLKENFDMLSGKIHKLYLGFNEHAQLDTLKSTISNSLEEMIEAFTFIYFLMTDSILPFERFMMIVKTMIAGYEPLKQDIIDGLLSMLLSKRSDVDVELNFNINFITSGDYFMGLFDLSGEVMRYAISYLMNGDKISEKSLSCLSFMKVLHSHFTELFDIYPDLGTSKGIFSRGGHSATSKKLQVMEQSISKVETLICDVCIREKEFHQF
ncbi:uncharacterized protein PRCAT00000754001 [Priceomyces carsonii]|uniref:uncharacterized protein n=1 Tax=Priceomyces carsonii TaxID=28549 RepID=UPI002ED8A4CD|nr:unnamed protein product [Priceomyces carsonii]